jgi:glycosyltransferase involved in cell wall biosynthesis
MERPLVSILIPAYNKPDYLRKTLRSIVAQTYRPLELIVSDDCSPNPLRPVVDEFEPFRDDSFNLRFFRQERNLGTQDNFRFVIQQAAGRYAVPWSHDNWFTDPNFVAEAVERVQSRPGCYLCLANAVYEDDQDDPMLDVPAELAAAGEWAVVGGDRILPVWGLKDWPGCMGWTQASLLDLDKAKALGLFEYPYAVDGPLAARLGIGADNGSGYVALLASLGCVGLTGKVVAVAGQPPDSFSRSAFWQRVANDTMFVIYYNVYRSRLGGPHEQQLRAHARQFLLYACVRHVNWRVLWHFGFRPEAIWLMLRSYGWGLGLPAHWQAWKRAVLRRLPGLGSPPVAIKAFPKGVTNPALDSHGIYEDGWVATSAWCILTQPGPSSLVVRGMLPLTDPKVSSSEVRITIDGQEVVRRLLTPGAIELICPVISSRGKRRIDVSFSQAQKLLAPDTRSVGMHLTYLGFDAAIPVQKATPR